jgi:dienelactone hydrolase
MQKIILMSMAMLLSIGFVLAQPYASGKRTLSFTDASRANRVVGFDLYYPAQTAGDNVPVAPGTAIFPVVVFGHGFVIPTSAYAWLGDSLARNGFIAAFPTTEGTFSPSHATFGTDLRFIASALLAAGNDANFFLYQRINPRVGFGGHSMGGGCSFLAAGANDPSLRALFNFAAAETNPSATTAAIQVTRPTLIFSGSNDCIVPPTTQMAMYQNVPAPCKTMITITEATHCQFSNNNFTCTFGQSSSGCNNSAITTSDVFIKVSSLLIPYLDYYLKDDCERGVAFLAAYNNLTGAVKVNTCGSFPNCNVVPVRLINFTGNQLGNSIQLKWQADNEAGLKTYIIEKSDDGQSFQVLLQQNAKGSQTINSYDKYDPNPYDVWSFYRLKMLAADGSFSYSQIIRVSSKQNGIIIEQLFPNPAKGKTAIKIYSPSRQNTQLQIVSLTGQILQKQSVTFNKGSQVLPVTLSQLAAGYYLIRLFDAKQHSLANMNLIVK